MKRKWIAAVCFAAVVFLQAGCGNQTAGGPDGQWNNKGDIALVMQENAENLHGRFEKSVGMTDGYSEEIHLAQDLEELKKLVSGNEYAIGVLPEEHLDDSVKAVLVDEEEDIAIVVSRKNGYERLTKAQVRQIFSGSLSAWNEVLPVRSRL